MSPKATVTLIVRLSNWWLKMISPALLNASKLPRCVQSRYSSAPSPSRSMMAPGCQTAALRVNVPQHAALFVEPVDHAQFGNGKQVRPAVGVEVSRRNRRSYRTARLSLPQYVALPVEAEERPSCEATATHVCPAEVPKRTGEQIVQNGAFPPRVNSQMTLPEASSANTFPGPVTMTISR